MLFWLTTGRFCDIIYQNDGGGAGMQIFKTEDYIPKDNTIGIFRSRGAADQVEHSHDFIEIVYAIAGEATQFVDGVEYRVSRGDTIFINYGVRHAFIATDAFEYINICFSPALLVQTVITSENALALLSLTAFDEMRQEGGGGVISFSGEERREIENILLAMLRENAAQFPFSARVLENYLNILITKMLRKTEMGADLHAKSSIWEEMSDYIIENLDSELTLSSLAKKCFYNPSYFSREFRRRFGVSLTEYVAKRRVESAIALLGEEGLTVEEISLRVGFSDRSAFYHAFAK